MNSLEEKLSIKCGEHYSLVCEHINPMRRNKLTLLDPKDTLARVCEMTYNSQLIEFSFSKD